MATQKDLQLGNKVKDRITGYIGIAYSISHYINSCVRVGVQGAVTKDNTVPEILYFDLEDLIVIGPGIRSLKKKGNGPMPAPKRN